MVHDVLSTMIYTLVVDVRGHDKPALTVDSLLSSAVVSLLYTLRSKHQYCD